MIKIEPPTGDPARRLGLLRQSTGPGKESFWFGFNNNKRGITLNQRVSRVVGSSSNSLPELAFSSKVYTPAILTL